MNSCYTGPSLSIHNKTDNKKQVGRMTKSLCPKNEPPYRYPNKTDVTLYKIAVMARDCTQLSSDTTAMIDNIRHDTARSIITMITSFLCLKTHDYTLQCTAICFQQFQ